MSGAKIIAGLKDAIAGNLSRVTIEGQTWVREDGVSDEQSAFHQAQARCSQLTVECTRLRVEKAGLVAALQGMIIEWDKLSRYGSPMAKAANDLVNNARAAIAKATEVQHEPSYVR